MACVWIWLVLVCWRGMFVVWLLFGFWGSMCRVLFYYRWFVTGLLLWNCHCGWWTCSIYYARFTQVVVGAVSIICGLDWFSFVDTVCSLGYCILIRTFGVVALGLRVSLLGWFGFVGFDCLGLMSGVCVISVGFGFGICLLYVPALWVGCLVRVCGLGLWVVSSLRCVLL